VQPGHRELINGASGGVGNFAVQIARSFGADVTGVCGTRNLAMVESIGADRVIDYTSEDFTRTEQRHDLMLDLVGKGTQVVRRAPTAKDIAGLGPEYYLNLKGSPLGNTCV
jgi:NADPH:quinone reductase-like Zn-dependent oxidoreductase